MRPPTRGTGARGCGRAGVGPQDRGGSPATATHLRPLIYGDPAHLHVHPTAVINNALFNLSSGEITVGKYAFFGHNVAILTGTHDVTKFGAERQVAVPKAGRDVLIGEEPGWPASSSSWGRAPSASTPWSASARWSSRMSLHTRSSRARRQAQGHDPPPREGSAGNLTSSGSSHFSR